MGGRIRLRERSPVGTSTQRWKSKVRVDCADQGMVFSEVDTAASPNSPRIESGRTSPKLPRPGTKAPFLSERRKVETVARSESARHTAAAWFPRAPVLVPLRRSRRRTGRWRHLAADPDRLWRPTRSFRQIDDEDHRELESFRGVNRHEVDGIERLEHGVGFVAGGQGIEVIGNPRERGVSAVLNSADQPAHLLHVLPGLRRARSAQLERECRLWQDVLDEVGRRNPIHL